MAGNKKQTSKQVASNAAKVLSDKNSSCKALEILDTVLHKIHAASATGSWAARTWAGVA